jgi:hypothetical protein
VFAGRSVPRTHHWDEMSGMCADTTLVVERVVVRIVAWESYTRVRQIPLVVRSVEYPIRLSVACCFAATWRNG